MTYELGNPGLTIHDSRKKGININKNIIHIENHYADNKLTNTTVLDKNQIAKRIAKELKDGFYVNLGIGIPTLVANYIPEGISVTLQSENGLLGMGPFPTEENVDPDLINAGKQTITTLPGSAFFDSALSFGMIRAGKVDLTVLGMVEAFGLRLFVPTGKQTVIRLATLPAAIVGPEPLGTTATVDRLEPANQPIPCANAGLRRVTALAAVPS